ncbi:MAG: 50S ribosomal protein L13 [Alphaproteobacteria bacterium]|nr:50S ribosomal protein L13 [Alphaproteobacteria bacterium]MDD9842192.1 50S ribosomal protein L13 [Alphaproteobacteria bacterium]
MKTYSAKAADIKKKWILIDAENLVVGRLAAIIARHLRGKHLPTFTPHMDCGDNVIVVNADKIKFSGKKTDNKTYYRHTGYPGGIKSTTPAAMLAGKQPERVLQLAVKRMLPRGALANKQFANLRVYAGPNHPHEAQNPEKLDVAALNAKNIRV